MKSETYKQAHTRILEDLLIRGWKLSNPYLKIQHATSPDGETRFWFKAQAIWMSSAPYHTLGESRSVHMDVRGLQTQDFLARTVGAL